MYTANRFIQHLILDCASFGLDRIIPSLISITFPIVLFYIFIFFPFWFLVLVGVLLAQNTAWAWDWALFVFAKKKVLFAPHLICANASIAPLDFENIRYHLRCLKLDINELCWELTYIFVLCILINVPKVTLRPLKLYFYMFLFVYHGIYF